MGPKFEKDGYDDFFDSMDSQREKDYSDLDIDNDAPGVHSKDDM